MDDETHSVVSGVYRITTGWMMRLTLLPVECIG